MTVYCSLLELGLGGLKHPIQGKRLNTWCSTLLHPAGLESLHPSHLQADWYQLSKWLFWLELHATVWLFSAFFLDSGYKDYFFSAHMLSCACMHCKHIHINTAHTLNGLLLEAWGPCEGSVELSTRESLRGEQTGCMQTEGSTRHRVHNRWQLDWIST